MRRILEIIFRHPLQLLLPILILPVVGAAIPYKVVQRTYQATASVWALQRYYVVGATGPESDLTSTPAETQAVALSELLQTRAFAYVVGHGIDIGRTLGLSESAMHDPQQLQDAIFSEISRHVVVTPSAYNLYDITYTNSDPRIAQAVVKSVIEDFGTQSLSLSVADGKNLLGIYGTQLANAQKTLNDAVATETRYVRAHQAVNILDPQYQLLDGQRIQAQASVQNIQNVINQIQQSIGAQGSGSSTLFQVIDAPQIPNVPVSRTRYFLIGGGIGLIIALLACIIYLIIVVRRNRGVYSEDDLQDLVEFPLVMQLPNLTPGAVSLLTTKTMQGQTLLTDRKSSSNGHN